MANQKPHFTDIQCLETYKRKYEIMCILLFLFIVGFKQIPLTCLCFLCRAVVTGATSGIGKGYAIEVSLRLLCTYFQCKANIT